MPGFIKSNHCHIIEFDDKSKGTQTNKPLEEEIMNNNDDEGSSLYQMSVGKLMHLRSMSSTDTSDSAATTMTTSVTTPEANTSTRLEELDNTGPEPEKQTSILWRPVSALKVYGTNVLSSYKEPFDSAIESGSSVLGNGATVIANNVMKIYLTEEYY